MIQRKPLQHRDFVHKLWVTLNISPINHYSHPVFIGNYSFATPLIKKVKKKFDFNHVDQE